MLLILSVTMDVTKLFKVVSLPFDFGIVTFFYRIPVFCELFRIAAGFFPRAHIRCRPAFNGKTSAVFRCIADTRLGIIIAVCLFGWLKSLRTGRKEEKKWIVPSRI